MISAAKRCHEILENDVRSKETPFNFLPLTYKRGRKIDLSLGYLVTDFCRLFVKKAAWVEFTVLFVCLFVLFCLFACLFINIQGKIGRWLKMVKSVSHIRCRFLTPSLLSRLWLDFCNLHLCTHNVLAVPTPMSKQILRLSKMDY